VHQPEPGVLLGIRVERRAVGQQGGLLKEASR
jgi:hypothetical protein